jgi:hypothetical protein
MSIHGVQNPLLSSLGTVGRPGAAGAGQVQPGQVRPGVSRPAPAAAQPAAVRPQQPLTAPTNALPAEAPPGTDPELWGVLTSEERAFFAKAASMGPLTYGRAAAGINGAAALQQGSPAMRGGRLDVRA